MKEQSEASELFGILLICAWCVLCLIIFISVVVAFAVLLGYGIQEVAHLASKLPPL
jgi:hypothetical protein